MELSFSLCGAQFQLVLSPVSACVGPSFSLCGAQFQLVWSPVSACVEPSFSPSTFYLSPSTAAKLLSDFHKFNVEGLYGICLTSISFVTVGSLTLMSYLGPQKKCCTCFPHLLTDVDEIRYGDYPHNTTD